MLDAVTADTPSANIVGRIRAAFRNVPVPAISLATPPCAESAAEPATNIRVSCGSSNARSSARQRLWRASRATAIEAATGKPRRSSGTITV